MYSPSQLSSVSFSCFVLFVFLGFQSLPWCTDDIHHKSLVPFSTLNKRTKSAE